MEALCNRCAYFCDRNRYTDGIERYFRVVGGGAGHWLRTFSVAVRAGLSLHRNCRRNCDVRTGVFPSHYWREPRKNPASPAREAPGASLPVNKNTKSGESRTLYFLLRGRDLHPRPPGYEPGELLLLHPAIGADCTTRLLPSQFIQRI